MTILSLFFPFFCRVNSEHSPSVYSEGRWLPVLQPSGGQCTELWVVPAPKGVFCCSCGHYLLDSLEKALGPPFSWMLSVTKQHILLQNSWEGNCSPNEVILPLFLLYKNVAHPWLSAFSCSSHWLLLKLPCIWIINKHGSPLCFS